MAAFLNAAFEVRFEKVRNPKSEIRKKTECRVPNLEKNPKSQIQTNQRLRKHRRFSDFGFLSDFGFRISDFGLRGKSSRSIL